LPGALVLGAAGASVAWLQGVLGRARRADAPVLERACAVLCVFAAVAWTVIYLAIVVSELAR
jgi:predicted small integral membrane protein